MAHQTSRLHRLLTLLDTGSTSVTRRTAARQIGEIARLHPAELRPLLRRVRQFLRSKNWDTRVAAAQAIGAIAENVRHVTLKELFAKTETELAKIGFVISLSKVLNLSSSGKAQSATSLSFSSFDIQRVLEFGASLLASTGQEFDVNVDNTKTAAERLARQKNNLRRRLGLDVCEQFMDVNDMIHDEDLVVQRVPQSNGDTRGHGSFIQTGVKQEVHDLVANMVPGHLSRSLSAREKNLLKRKAKGVAKDGSKDWPEEEDVEEAAPKRAKSTKTVITEQPQSADKLVMEATLDEDAVDNESNGRWPFGYFVELLILDMFDSVWEVRHGSIMALREILSTQAASAAVVLPALDEAAPDLNSAGSAHKGRNFDLDLNAGLEEDRVDTKKVKEGEEHNSKDRVYTRDDMSATRSNMLAQGDAASERRRDSEKPILDLNTFDLNLELNDEHTEKLQTGDGPFPQLVEENVSKSALLEKDIGADDLLVQIPRDSKASKLFMAARESWAGNLEFIQDTTIRLLCVFALDRFGDYVSDQVVAPVRETCAQVLGASLKHMPDQLALETLNILLQMQNRTEWEVRHGSLLGIKYLVAVRQDMLPVLLPRVLPACMVGLEDADDDVRAVAAEALTPAAAAMVSSAGASVTNILLCLWDILLDLDDLSPSTSSVMHLLAELYSQPGVVSKTVTAKPPLLDLNESADVATGLGLKDSCCGDDPFTLVTLAPRLWPFMRHNIASVRHAAIRTLERLLEAGNQGNLGNCENGSFWATPILGDSLRLVFQNLLLESDEAILQCSKRVWRLLLQSPQDDLAVATGSYFASWLKLASTALGTPLEVSKMFYPNSLPRRSRLKTTQKMTATMDGKIRLGGPGMHNAKELSIKQKVGDNFGSQASKVVVGAEGEKSAVQMRVATSSALGIMVASLPEGMLESVNTALLELLSSASGVQRQVAAMVIVSWFKELRTSSKNEKLVQAVSAAQSLRARLLQLLAVTDPAAPTPGSPVPYTETLRIYSKMRGEAGAFIRNAEASGVAVAAAARDQPLDSMSAEAAIQIAKTTGKGAHAGDTSRDSKLVSSSDLCESSRQRLLATAGYLICIQANLHVSVLASLAGAVVWMGELPAKLNPIIHPLLAAVKREQEENLQQPAAEALGEVIGQCAKRKPVPIEKLIKNLANLTCQDPVETPLATPSNASVPTEDNEWPAQSGKTNCGVKAKAQTLATDEEERAKLEGAITRRGAELSLRALCDKFGSSLFDELPKLWECLTESLGQGTAIDANPSCLAWSEVALPTLRAEPQALINNLQTVRSIAPVLSSGLQSQLLTLLPAIIHCVAHQHALVRLSAAKCIRAMAKAITGPVMAAVLTKAVPMLGDMSSIEARQGAGLLVSSLVEGLGPNLVAYAPHLIVPLLGCMSDTNSNVRQSVTHSFAALVPLLPLARGLPSPPGLDGCQASKTTEDTRFLEQLLDNTRVDDYKVVVPINATLRRYQQEGINWLAFLKRFKLHGILCDDMGLGKTLQASVIIASDTAERLARYNQSNSPDVTPLPSLIVCPSTLVGHWVYEIEKFISPDALNPLQYSGSPQERLSLQSHFTRHNVVVTSYDVLRKDVEFLSQKLWNYCVLDEGHAIKNAKSKITLATKQIQAEHRLILSGTPIQNHVLELWSLFDFLMPGFLGSERQFQSSYGKPLSAARDAKSSAKEAEEGALAMEALHKQVMPFLLRRTKDQVLADLPPKIIQDRYCDLSPLQLRLYEGFSRSQAKKEVSMLVEAYGDAQPAESGNPAGGASTHVFQALQYLRRLCSHPLLVLDSKLQDKSFSRGLEDSSKSDSDAPSGLHDLENAPKLLALKEILEECGIGVQGAAGDSEGGQHRVLVFAQLKSFLDIIEQDLFATHMKSVTYLRLDGSVETEKRFGIVKAFNADPTIDVLLLTTHVGGLGLNLTAADTVVFMEHDWNPMRDLQAMDRAHRLGQRRVVNVHRLIMRGTLEEKVMSLQRFKLSVANTVINAENASLNTMDTTQLLDLFTVSAKSGKVGVCKKSGEEHTDDAAGTNAVGGGKGMKAMLNGLEELWDQSQYTDEYNLNEFVSRLKN